MQLHEWVYLHKQIRMRAQSKKMVSANIALKIHNTVEGLVWTHS